MEPVIAFCAGFLAVSVGIWWGRQIGAAERKGLEKENKWLEVENSDLLDENEELVDLLDDYGHWDCDEDEKRVEGEEWEEINVELTDCEKCNGKKELCFPATCPKEFENGEYLHEAKTLTSEQYDQLWKQITSPLSVSDSVLNPPSEPAQTLKLEDPKPVTDDTVDFTESKPVPKLYGQEFKGCCN